MTSVEKKEEFDVEKPQNPQQEELLLEGDMLKRSEIMKNWNHRKLKLDLDKQTLTISHQKTVKNIQLPLYTLKHLEPQGKKKLHTLLLEAKDKKHKDLLYKEIYLASETKSITDNWYASFQKALEDKEDPENLKKKLSEHNHDRKETEAALQEEQ